MSGTSEIVGLYEASPTSVATGQQKQVGISADGAVRVSGTVTAAPSAVGAGTAAAAERVTLASDDPAVTSLASIDGGTPAALGQGTMAQSMRVVVASDQSQLQVIPFFNGSGISYPGGANGLVVKPYSGPASDWAYAAATGGIANTTTAVTIKAAAGASVKNYLTGLQLSSDPLGAATEFAIRDGAGGTVLWRMKIGTAGIVNGLSISFPTPLVGTANTLLEVVTLTASITGGVFVNAQGFTAA